MFIISLYHIDLKPLTHKPQRFTYGQSLINHIKGFRTLVVGNRLPAGLQPLLPHALPCRITQIDRAFKQASRFADGDVACIRQLWGKTFHAGRHQRPADPPQPWAQTYHGLHGRGSCPQSPRAGQAERQPSSRSLAEGHGQRSERPDIQAFLSILAQGE